MTNSQLIAATPPHRTPPHRTPLQRVGNILANLFIFIAVVAFLGTALVSFGFLLRCALELLRAGWNML